MFDQKIETKNIFQIICVNLCAPVLTLLIVLCLPLAAKANNNKDDEIFFEMLLEVAVRGDVAAAERMIGSSNMNRLQGRLKAIVEEALDPVKMLRHFKSLIVEKADAREWATFLAFHEHEVLAQMEMLTVLDNTTLPDRIIRLCTLSVEYRKNPQKFGFKKGRQLIMLLREIQKDPELPSFLYDVEFAADMNEILDPIVSRRLEAATSNEEIERVIRKTLKEIQSASETAESECKRVLDIDPKKIN